MTKQTAVEWLLEQLKEYDFSPRENTYLIEIPSWILTEKEEQVKQMEKEQIKDAYDNGEDRSSELYYNETYGGDK